MSDEDAIFRKHTKDGVGSVEILDFMGSDLTTVNAARVSMGKRKLSFDEKDAKLIHFLVEHDPEIPHTAPFRHVVIQFHFKMPEFVARQFYKHIVGSDYAFKDHAWNEISGRYVEYEEFWHPAYFRISAPSIKQGSIDQEHEQSAEFVKEYARLSKEVHEFYQRMVIAGVAKEQARTILGVNLYTEFIWTASLHCVAHFVNLRNHPHAQKEIQEYAVLVDEMIGSIAPVSWSVRRKIR